MDLRYGRLLRHPGAIRLVVSGLPARLPIATYGIGLLALVRERSGSFGVAGAVVAAYTLAAVCASVVLGRWAQRAWFPRLLVAAALLDLASMLALLAAVRAGAGPIVVTALSTLVGASLPPAGAVARTRWSAVLGAPEELDQAMFLESALDEAVFVVGPAMVGAVGALAGAEAALLVAVSVSTLGVLGLAAVRPSDAGPDTPRPVGSPGRATPAIRLYVGVLALGAVFAAVQIGVFALTREAGSPSAAGAVLTCFSVASLVSGLLVGRRGSMAPLRLGLTLLGLALVVPALAAARVGVLAVLLLPAACVASPCVALGFAQVARTVEPGHRAAAFAWCSAGLGGGLALGSAGWGLVAEREGGAAVLFLGALVALAGARVAPRQRLAVSGDEAGDSIHGLGVTAAGSPPGD